MGYPLTFGLASEGDRSYETIAVTGDIDGSDPACDVTVDGYGTVTLSGTDAWGGDLSSENGFVRFLDPVALPATSAVNLGATDSSYGMAYFDFSGHTGTYTLPNVFTGVTMLSFQNADVDLSGDSSGFTGFAYIPEFDAGTAAARRHGERQARRDDRARVTRHPAWHGHGRATSAPAATTPRATSPRAPPTPMWACCTPPATVHPFNGMSYTVDMTDALGSRGHRPRQPRRRRRPVARLRERGRAHERQAALRRRRGEQLQPGDAVHVGHHARHRRGHVVRLRATSQWTPAGSTTTRTGSFRVQKVDEESGGATIQLVYTPRDTHTWDGGAGWDDQNWSTPKNWVDDSLPSNGDDLVFPDWTASGAINDDFLTSVGSVDLGMAV